MTSTNFFGSVVISGGVVASTNPIIHYHTYDLNSASPVDAHSQGQTPPGAHEAPSSTNLPTPRVPSSAANTSLPTTRPQRSFPRSFSLDSDSHPEHEAPNFSTDPRRSSTLPLSSLDSLSDTPPPHIRRSSTLPLPSLESPPGSHSPPSDWPTSYTEAPDVIYGFRVPIRRDSAIPFRPIGNPLQDQSVSRQRADEYVYNQTYGPMPTVPTLGHQPLTTPVVWGEHHPVEGYGMPLPRYDSTAPSTSSWPVDDRDIETTDEAEQNYHGYPGQTYC